MSNANKGTLINTYKVIKEYSRLIINLLYILYVLDFVSGQHRSTYNSNGKLLVPKQPFEIKYIDGNVCSGYLARDKFQVRDIN